MIGAIQESSSTRRERDEHLPANGWWSVFSNGPVLSWLNRALRFWSLKRPESKVPLVDFFFWSSLSVIGPFSEASCALSDLCPEKARRSVALRKSNYYIVFCFCWIRVPPSWRLWLAKLSLSTIPYSLHLFELQFESRGSLWVQDDPFCNQKVYKRFGEKGLKRIWAELARLTGMMEQRKLQVSQRKKQK